MLYRGFSLLTLFLMLTLVATAQAPNWWTTAEGNTEVGKMQEVKQKRKVFLNIAFTSNENDVNAQQETTMIRRVVTRAVAAYKGLEIVGTSDQAELTISVIASQSNPGTGTANFSANLDPGVTTPLEVAVLVRGAMQRNGTWRPRIVWLMSSVNVQGQPGPAAVFAVDGFIDQLKKLRGEK